MDSSFFPIFVAAAICFFMIFRKFRSDQENKEFDSSSLATSLPSSSLSVPPSSSSHICVHDVFPSFRGEDVRRDFLSHIQKEFQRKGITPFIDNEIKRGESIGSGLIRAIRGSKIAIILLSGNYASSKWCLDELVEIMTCREELGQTVMAIFYKVDPSHVKKLTGDFGKIFRKTCEGKTRENIRRWKEVLAKVATIAGYHSSNWDNEAHMIEKIATDVSSELISSVPSRDFDNLVGMRAHMEKMKPLLGLGSDEVRMIGIWGPSGIGKSTIARVLFSQHSHKFQLSVFMENIKGRYPRPCFDEYSAKLQLQKEFLSQMMNQEDLKINHLGIAQNRLNDKRILVVLDDVDKLAQLDSMAKETQWFGPGSRIIITTEDKKLLSAHGIYHIYEVGFPAYDEALQIFCMYAFGQKSPCDGFRKLALEAARLGGSLPLGLRVMGSYFKGMPKHEWEKSLPRLKASLDGEIVSIFKFSYDALCDEDKELFLYIACFFNNERIKIVEGHLENNFSNVRQGLNVLAEKSLISLTSWGSISMHDLLARFGREIVRKQSIHEPGKRQFLVDAGDVYQVLRNDTVDIRSVIGIDFRYSEIDDELDRSDKAFERMPSVQFLRLHSRDHPPSSYLPQSLNYLPRKVRLLRWYAFPMTCLPSSFNPEFLVELHMPMSQLEKLWEGIHPIRNLKWMNLMYSDKLKELPDLSTATDLQKLDLCGCSSLGELPSSLGNIINLQLLNLRLSTSLVAKKLLRVKLSGCSSLVELPSYIGNIIDLKRLDLSGCSSLVKLPSSIGNLENLWLLDLHGCSSLVKLPSSIGNLQNLQSLDLQGCLKLEALPISINLESLEVLDLTNCSSLKSFPQISTNIRFLRLNGTGIEEIPSSIRSWSLLDELHMSYCENLWESQHAFDLITDLHLDNTRIQEIATWVKGMPRLHKLVINGCTELVSFPDLQGSLLYLDAENCESLERLDVSFHNTSFRRLNFANCFKLNQEARDHLIIRRSTCSLTLLPGDKVPTYFSNRVSGSSVSLKLNTHIHGPLRLKACVLLVNKGDVEDCVWEAMAVTYGIVEKHNDTSSHRLSKSFDLQSPLLKEHLCIFEFDEMVSSTSSELVFEFGVCGDDIWEIKECGILCGVPRVS